MNSIEFNSSSLETLPPNALAARLDQLMTRERHCLVEFLLHLAAFDQGRGYLELGYASLFVYCTDRLKMSNGTAFRRTTSARLVDRFPVIVDYLRDGRLSTTALCELREVLNEANHREILERACGLDEEGIKLLAATLHPKAELAESVRRVPVRHVPVIRPTLVQTPPSSPKTVEVPVEPATTSIVEVTLPPKPSVVEPLTGERYAVRMTVSKAFIDEFRQVRNALSHVVPGGKMEDVLRECMRIAREVCERRMHGSSSPRATRSTNLSGDGDEVRPPDPGAANETSSVVEPTPNSAKARRQEPGSRHLPVAVRREVFERDKGCCTFVGANGKRCGSKHQLQFHHKVPFARGGPSTPENLTLHCAGHNKHRAYEDFGASHMNRFAPVSRGHSTQLMGRPG